MTARRRDVRAKDVATFAEAYLALTVAYGVRRSLPAHRWQRLLGDRMVTPPDEIVDEPTKGAEQDVATALARATRRQPWQPRCLDQALAGQLMLRRRHRPGTAVIGLRPGAAWDVHAWLLGSTGTIVGGPAGVGFTPVTAFRPTGAR